MEEEMKGWKRGRGMEKREDKKNREKKESEGEMEGWERRQKTDTRNEVKENKVKCGRKEEDRKG